MFLLVFLPVFLISTSLTADFSRALLVSRQTASTAEAMAMAGATAFSPTRPGELVYSTAVARAERVFTQARELGAIPSEVRVKQVSVGDVALTAVPAGMSSVAPRVVRVELEANVELGVVSAIRRIFGADNDATLTDTARREAYVCIPGFDPATGDYYIGPNPIGGCTYVVF